MRLMILMLLAIGLTACPSEGPQGAMVNSGGGGVPPSTSTPGMPMMDMSPDTTPGPITTTDEGELFTLLSDAQYQGWASPSEPYAADPHGEVRAFLNPTLAASLRAGNELHPVDSMAVLERYEPNGDLGGWSVMLKVDTDDAGDWFWYETDDLEDPEKFQVSGIGSPTCVGCHTNGVDMIQGVYDL